MSNDVGQWTPKEPVAPGRDEMQQLAERFRTAPDEDISSWLPADDITRGRAMMRLPADAWHMADALSTDDLIALVQFFTLAEMQLPGWDGGKNSPVIPLVRLLKARESFSADLRRWIKANTDNRYLPYGSAL